MSLDDCCVCWIEVPVPSRIEGEDQKRGKRASFQCSDEAACTSEQDVRVGRERSAVDGHCARTALQHNRPSEWCARTMAGDCGSRPASGANWAAAARWWGLRNKVSQGIMRKATSLTHGRR